MYWGGQSPSSSWGLRVLLEGGTIEEGRQRSSDIAESCVGGGATVGEGGATVGEGCATVGEGCATVGEGGVMDGDLMVVTGKVDGGASARTAGGVGAERAD